MLGEEGVGDISSRSIFGQFQRVVKSDQKRISKCGERHCNLYRIYISSTESRVANIIKGIKHYKSNKNIFILNISSSDFISTFNCSLVPIDNALKRKTKYLGQIYFCQICSGLYPLYSVLFIYKFIRLPESLIFLQSDIE